MENDEIFERDRQIKLCNKLIKERAVDMKSNRAVRQWGFGLESARDLGLTNGNYGVDKLIICDSRGTKRG